MREGDQQSSWTKLEEIPEPLASTFTELVRNRGVEHKNLLGYLFGGGQLPDLDWALLAAFASVAGAGGITNSLLSNYVRDKGWGMGARVGVIPSAIGGGRVTLSHTGQVFPPQCREPGPLARLGPPRVARPALHLDDRLAVGHGAALHDLLALHPSRPGSG